MTEHDNAHETHDDHAHDEHPTDYALYFKVAIALVVLTALSYWTFTPLWPFGESVELKRLWMMAVSCCKASLVIMVFMHLWWEANWKWVLTVPASCMCVFLTLALVPDVGMRIYNGFGGYSRERLIYAADLPEPKQDVDADHADDDHDHVDHDETH
jgi:cytochrome c oxidase subunit 4